MEASELETRLSLSQLEDRIASRQARMERSLPRRAHHESEDEQQHRSRSREYRREPASDAAPPHTTLNDSQVSQTGRMLAESFLGELGEDL